MRLMGKHNDEEEWEDMGTHCMEVGDDHEYQKKVVISQYEKEFGKNWQFKWEDE